MAVAEDAPLQLSVRFGLLLPHHNERQRCLLLATEALPLGRARRPGGGRKRAEDNDPGLVPALLGLVEPDERGDPMSPLRWTTKSLRCLAGELSPLGAAAAAECLAVDGDDLSSRGRGLAFMEEVAD